MVRTLALLGLVAVAAATTTAAPGAAQQPLRPLPKVGSCPIGYFASGDYCMPGGGRSTRGGIEKVGSSCPIGFFASGNYCLSGRDSSPEAIHKTGSSCPIGWFSSGRYCLRSR
jgi:hypothetical protein